MNTKDKKPEQKEKSRNGGVEEADTVFGQPKNWKEVRAEEEKPDEEDALYMDSFELFSSLFRAENQSLAGQDRKSSHANKADSPPGKAGASPPLKRSGPPLVKQTPPKSPSTKPTHQGPKGAGGVAAPRERGKAGPASEEKMWILMPQAKEPAQVPPLPETGHGVQQGAAREPSRAAAGDMPPKEERIPVKGEGGKGRKVLKLVILLAVLGVLAAFSLYYFGIIGLEKPRRAATPAESLQKKPRIPGEVQKRLPKKMTKPAPVLVKKAPAQMPQQGPPVPEKPKSPGQETKAAPAATAVGVREQPVPPVVPKTAPVPVAQAQAPAAALFAYPYSVYLGSYRNRKTLERAVSEYHGLGLSSYWVQVDLGDKGTWYRLFTGYFPNKEDAEAFIREKNIKDGEHRNTRYANLIGVFRSEEELQKLRLSVAEAGFCPYMVQGPDGQWMLYTGAFYQKSRAEKQNRELDSKGIQSRLVER